MIRVRYISRRGSECARVRERGGVACKYICVVFDSAGGTRGTITSIRRDVHRDDTLIPLAIQLSSSTGAPIRTKESLARELKGREGFCNTCHNPAISRFTADSVQSRERERGNEMAIIFHLKFRRRNRGAREPSARCIRTSLASIRSSLFPVTV